MVDLQTPVSEQVDALQGWRKGCVEADEVAATLRALDWLREAGHPEAKPLCVKTLRAGDMAVEVSGIVVAKDCVAIIEARSKLDSGAAKSLAADIAKIRVMLKSEEPSDSSPLGQLKGKQLLPVLYGRTITTNTADLDEMAAICQQNQIQCWDEPWDTSGSGVEASPASSFRSPYVHTFGTYRRDTTTAATAGSATSTSWMGTKPAMPFGGKVFHHFSPRGGSLGTVSLRTHRGRAMLGVRAPLC